MPHGFPWSSAWAACIDVILLAFVKAVNSVRLISVNNSTERFGRYAKRGSKEEVKCSIASDETAESVASAACRTAKLTLYLYARFKIRHQTKAVLIIRHR